MTLVRNDIFWVGAVDWNVRDFHGYDTYRGTSYNAYLIRGEKNVLIDTVKAPFAHELLNNIREYLPLEKIDYVVCNHAEPDHSGSLPIVMQSLPNATLLCNAKCQAVLGGYFSMDNWKTEIVSPDKPISLGGRSLAFLDVPMVHWPESMVTWLPEERILFSNDSFGQHIATSERFDDEWELPRLIHEAQSYYANIVTPYGRQVLKTLQAASKLDIDLIAPSHGLIWRKNIPAIVSAYNNWASGKCNPKVLVIYDTMWDSTGQMAREIVRGASTVEGVQTELIHVRKTSLARIATEMLDASAVAMGTPTLNGQMMPQLAAALNYIEGLKFTKKKSMAFGSFGWAAGGSDAVVKWLEKVQYPILVPTIQSKWRPVPDDLSRCFNAGVELARAVR